MWITSRLSETYKTINKKKIKNNRKVKDFKDNYIGVRVSMKEV